MRSAAKIWRGKEKRLKNLGKTGKVVSWTKILESPEGFEDKPYYVVMVEVKDKKAVGQMVEGREPKVGDKVVGVLRRLGEAKRDEVIEYGVKWKKV